MESKCKNCTHWHSRSVGEEDEVSWDAYAPGRRCDFLNLDQPESDYDNDPVLPMCLGYVGRVDLVTHPEFGCIHFKAR